MLTAMIGRRPRLIGIAASIALVSAVLLGGWTTPASASRFLDAPAIPWGEGSIVYHGSSTARVSRSKSLTIAQPMALPGDIMVAAVTTRLSGGGAISSPDGWTVVRRDNNVGGTALSQVLLYKFVVTFEPPSYTWRFSSSTNATGGITAYSGVDVFSPVNGQDGQFSADTRLIAAPSLTTTVNGSLVLGLYGNSARGSMVAPTGMIEDFEVTA